MNQHPAKAKFYFSVHARNSYAILPYNMADKNLEARIMEFFFEGDDFACASFELKDSQDLMVLFCFYAERNVEMQVSFEVESTSLKTHACLSNGNPPNFGTYEFKNVSPSKDEIANKMVSLANALKSLP